MCEKLQEPLLQEKRAYGAETPCNIENKNIVCLVRCIRFVWGNFCFITHNRPKNVLSVNYNFVSINSSGVLESTNLRSFHFLKAVSINYEDKLFY